MGRSPSMYCGSEYIMTLKKRKENIMTLVYQLIPSSKDHVTLRVRAPQETILPSLVAISTIIVEV